MKLNKIFKSVGHYFAVLVQDIPVAVSWLGKANTKLVDVAANIDAHKGKLLGDAFALVQSADDAALAKGLNLTLDAAFVQALKQSLQDIEALKPGATVAPAGLPVIAPGLNCEKAQKIPL